MYVYDVCICDSVLDAYTINWTSGCSIETSTSSRYIHTYPPTILTDCNPLHWNVHFTLRLLVCTLQLHSCWEKQTPRTEIQNFETLLYCIVYILYSTTYIRIPTIHTAVYIPYGTYCIVHRTVYMHIHHDLLVYVHIYALHGNRNIVR